MLSCSLLFSDPFFLLNTLHYSLIFRFVKQFFKKYYVFFLKIVKIYFLTQKTRIFIIEEKAQNQKASYNEDSFAMLDDVLDWCETYQVYAVVDFHAATAGQSGIPCDDGVDNGQHLYDDEESMERMFLLMEEFMRRYKDRWIIGAYQRADLHDAAPRGADTEAGLFLRGNDPPLQKDRPETLIFAEWYTVFLSYIFL